MKKYLTFLLVLVATMTITSCGNDEPENPDKPETENPTDPETPLEPSEDSNILIAYFSWGGTTERMAKIIADQTGGTLFEIEPVVPYPAEYTPCTEVALEEKNDNARPAIKDKVENWRDYDIVFIGCPVWWWTTPMIIHTFCESYDFKGKTVVPFCTYASTYRDETLAEIANSTPDAAHLTGEGLTSGRISEQTISSWLKEIKVVK